jgi:hypothetical protein
MEVEIPLIIEEKDCGMKLGNHRLHTARGTQNMSPTCFPKNSFADFLSFICLLLTFVSKINFK